MTRTELDAWSVLSRARYADDLVAAGLYAEAEASAAALRVFSDVLPDGLATPGHHLWTVHLDDDDAVVGHLWLQRRLSATGVEAYVMDVDVDPERRSTGLGRATMAAAERAARDLGATVLRLNVFTHNRVAVALYDSLGYVATESTLTRWAGSPPARPARVVGPAVRLRDLSTEEYAGLRPVLETERAAQDLDRLLPQGPATAGHRLWAAVSGDECVGHLWLGLEQRPDGRHAGVLHLAVREDLRGRGYGSALALAAEEECRRLQVRSVRVAVSTGAARSWGERNGFAVTAQTRAKRLVRSAR
jgi:GNAT superfamily N-acetyltransferase